MLEARLLVLSGMVQRTSADPVGGACEQGLLKLLSFLPPVRDGHEVAEMLRSLKDEQVEWCLVRPGMFEEGQEVTAYEVYEGKGFLQSAREGRKSLICNTAHFMAELVTKEEQWLAWKGKAPVVLDK